MDGERITESKLLYKLAYRAMPPNPEATENACKISLRCFFRTDQGMIEIGHCLGDLDSILIDETTTTQTNKQKHTHTHTQTPTHSYKKIHKDNRKAQTDSIKNNAYRVSISLFFGLLLTCIHHPYITVLLQANIIAVLFISV